MINLEVKVRALIKKYKISRDNWSYVSGFSRDREYLTITSDHFSSSDRRTAQIKIYWTAQSKIAELTERIDDLEAILNDNQPKDENER